MKNRMMTLAGTLLLVAVLGKFYVPPLLAQVRAALVKNVDEPGRSPYQAVPVSTNDCGAYAFLNFPPVPMGKRLVVTFVSGGTSTEESSPAFARVYTLNSPMNTCENNYTGPFAVVPISDKVGGNDTSFSGPVQFYIEEGRSPVLFVVTGFSSHRTQSFTVVGYLIDKSL